MQLPLCFFHSLLNPLPSRGSLVTLLPLLLNSHSYLFYKWICSKLVVLFLLHAVDNLSLPLCHAQVCLAVLFLLLLLLLVLSMMLLHVVVLTTLRRNQHVHWFWRNSSNTSMIPPYPNDMPHGSN